MSKKSTPLATATAVDLDPVFEDAGGLPNMVDIHGVRDIFCCDLASIERLGLCAARLTFTARESANDGTPLNVVVAKLVVPADILDGIARALLGDAPQIQEAKISPCLN